MGNLAQSYLLPVLICKHEIQLRSEANIHEFQVNIDLTHSLIILGFVMIYFVPSR